MPSRDISHEQGLRFGGKGGGGGGGGAKGVEKSKEGRVGLDVKFNPFTAMM